MAKEKTTWDVKIYILCSLFCYGDDKNTSKPMFYLLSLQKSGATGCLRRLVHHLKSCHRQVGHVTSYH